MEANESSENVFPNTIRLFAQCYYHAPHSLLDEADKLIGFRCSCPLIASFIISQSYLPLSVLLRTDTQLWDVTERDSSLSRRSGTCRSKRVLTTVYNIHDDKVLSIVQYSKRHIL
jgi:hypothetical protein